MAITDLTQMVQNSHLSTRTSSFHWWVILAVTSNVITSNIVDRHVLYNEAHIPRKSFAQSFVVHLSRICFCCDRDWNKRNHHDRFENISLHSTHRDSTNTISFIDIMEEQSQRFVSWMSYWADIIQSSQHCHPTGTTISGWLSISWSMDY